LEGRVKACSFHGQFKGLLQGGGNAGTFFSEGYTGGGFGYGFFAQQLANAGRFCGRLTTINQNGANGGVVNNVIQDEVKRVKPLAVKAYG